MRALATAAALLLTGLIVGCTSTTVAGHTPPASPPISPSPSPSSIITVLPSASPSVADLPLTTAPFACRLPVLVETSSSNPVTFHGGFIDFPSAGFAADPRGEIDSQAGGDTLTTAATPVLAGRTSGPPFYDAAASRWIPAGAAQSSPDDTRYAYAVTGASSADGAVIHVVSVATGADRTFKVSVPSVGAPAGIEVEDFDGTYVYFAVAQFEGYPSGTWRLNAASGAVTAMARVDNVMAVKDGFAWVGAVDPHDSNPPQVPASRRLFDTIVRVALGSGARTTWIYKPGQSVVVNAVDSLGRAIISVSSPPDFLPFGGEIRRVDEPVSGGENNGELVYPGGLGFDVPQPDGDRVWFGNDQGIYLYTAGGGMQKVYAVTPKPGQTLVPAGFCR